MNTLTKLQRFINFHKSTSVSIDHDNGYGGASWSVKLLSHLGEVYACAGYLDDYNGVSATIESTEYDYCGWLVNTAWYHETLYVSQKSDINECGDAEQVLRAALDYWEVITGVTL